MISQFQPIYFFMVYFFSPSTIGNPSLKRQFSLRELVVNGNSDEVCHPCNGVGIQFMRTLLASFIYLLTTSNV